ncbi:hypothetical protein HNP48_005931 [Acidovorax soli]|uniref:Uncharacterized protein n=1 Tax=Acidovorax soli TaxID=592050 RepID=A0A7X0PKI7_9BURK|nr:hypothetical protein [Acidovorax soli]MBB6563212.1 hypothetical protein [Acidovorax soli]
MYPLSIEDLDPSPGGTVFWKILPGLAVAMLVVCALALIASFLIVTSASAQVRDGSRESVGRSLAGLQQQPAHRP